MVEQPRNSAICSWSRRAWVARTVAIVFGVCLGVSSQLTAQQPPVHYLYQGNEPPGAIGSRQLLRGGPLPGYFQPVEIRAPEGALVSLAVDGAFLEPIKTPVRVGMLIAPVYRLRITNIPLHEGREVFPTIEIIDRLYPPVREALRFPIPIELTQADIELALDGHYITRVIFLEDPGQALPIATGCKDQNWFDAGPGSNPVEVADRLGRPMAILRLGGRLPDRTGPDQQFLAGCPPFIPIRCPPPYPVETVPAPQRQPATVPTSRRQTAAQSSRKQSTEQPSDPFAIAEPALQASKD